MHGEASLGLLQLPRPRHPVITNSDGIARLHLQVVRQPLRDNDRSLRPCRRQSRRAGLRRRGHGVGRDAAGFVADLIDQICQDTPRLRQGRAGCGHYFGSQKYPSRGQDPLIPRRCPGQPGIFQRHARCHGLRHAGFASRQQKIRPPRQFRCRLQLRKRHKHVQGGFLIRFQTERPHGLVRPHFHYRAAQGHRQIRFS